MSCVAHNGRVSAPPGGYDDTAAERALEAVRRACLRLPESVERLSHGGPAFFVGTGRCFCMVLDNHHGDGRLAVWCAAPEGVQADLVDSDPERFFRPPYVGHRGWLGVQLTETDADELDAILREAYRCVAPKRLLAQLG